MSKVSYDILNVKLLFLFSLLFLHGVWNWRVFERWVGGVVLKATLHNGSIIDFALERAEKHFVHEMLLLLLVKTPTPLFQRDQRYGVWWWRRSVVFKVTRCLQPLDMQQKTEKTRCHVDWVYSWPDRQTSGCRVLRLPGLPSCPCHQRILGARLISFHTCMWELLKTSAFLMECVNLT